MVLWNTQGVALNITILPPWWATWWFRGLVILFVVCLTFSYHWYRIKNLLHQKLILKQKVKERTFDLEKANQELGEQKEQILEQNKVLVRQTEDLKWVNRMLAEKKHLIEGQNEEILTQRDNLLDLNKKIEQANQYKLQFFTNISHEFRTPLTLILGPIEKLLTQWESNIEVKNFLMVIKKNSQRLKNLINELMDFREIESDKAILTLSNGDIVKFVTEIAEAFFDLAKHQNIQLNIKSRDDSIETCFDFGKMEKILYNLISNAFKYTKPNGLIEIDVYQQKNGNEISDADNCLTLGEFVPDKDYVVITVKDTGIGIEETYLSDIFIRFTRLKTAEFIHGTGIGLALAKDLVAMHNGTISVSSKIDEGSIFSIRIPIIANTELCDNNTSDYQMNFSREDIPFLTENIIAGDTKPAYVEKIKSGKKILIVEDNNDLRYFIAQQFTSKYNVIEASNGNEGLKLAQIHMPDIIVCDILMPGLSGIDLCKRLKTDLYTCHIPFIFLTALAETENQMTGLECRADDYISKPFEPAILELKVRNIIESRQKLKSIYSASESPKASEITTNSRDEQFLQKAIDVVNENMLKSNFCITDFNEAMGVSRSLLYKKLISLTGHSATDFIISIRLKKALQLLKNKDLNISEISYMVGFNTPKYFSRCFRRYYGKNPTQYYDTILWLIVFF
jgi:signal transduction histidine kinase/AraC-like DNA-binding protein/ActR/RegA family two-component response regulator